MPPRSNRSSLGSSSRPVHRNRVITSENDNISRSVEDLVPDKYRDTGRYIDVVQWNIEWFGARKSEAKDRSRFDRVCEILEAFNSDIFVFQEIAGPSSDGRYPGVLDDVAEELRRRNAGDYVVFYTRAGGEQRVAMMWDRDWIRAKSDVEDLFPRGKFQKAGEKDPFAGRTPLYGYFTARIPEDQGNVALSPDKFDFQVLGVHLKAMGDGAPQRKQSAEVLAKWLTTEAPTVDADAMILGDWNAAPDAPEWKPIRDLEGDRDHPVAFSKINDPSEYSYLWLSNRPDRFMSRIDLTAITLSSETQIVGDAVARVVKWQPIEEALARAGSMTDAQVVKVLKEVKETISDHLPTHARFYIEKRQAR